MTYGLIALIDKQTKPMPDLMAKLMTTALVSQARSVGMAYKVTAQSVVWYGSHDELVPHGAWPIVILDEPDIADALGYHDLDPNGQPYGRVFATPARDAKVSLSSVISHEVVEAIVDPYANLWADTFHGTSYAFEACDPVESDSYMINGVEVSNFVTRAWFDPNEPVGPFDHMHKLTAPLSMSSGGYLIKMVEGKIANVFGARYPEWRKELKHAPQPSRTAWRAVRQLV